VIKKPRKNEEAKARYRAVENTTTMGCNARKTNKHRRLDGTKGDCKSRDYILFLRKRKKNNELCTGIFL
jgi:hypothetical protein